MPEENKKIPDELLTELAALPILDYEMKREAVAADYNIRKTILDTEVDKRRAPEVGEDRRYECRDFDLWYEKVDGQQLADGLVRAIRRYCILPDNAAEAVALWILHAHSHDTAHISPILALESPEKRCGKTTLLSVISELVPRCVISANITTAALFRFIEMHRPTLLIDEGDTFLKDNPDLRGILNSGHNQKMAYVTRCVGDNNEPRSFNTWAPKVIALIGTLPDTLQDRSIIIMLQRKTALEKVDRFRSDKTEYLTELGSKTARWASDNTISLHNHDPESMPGNLNDRARDNWRHLFAIADLLGGDWPDMARQAAVGLQAADNDDEGSYAVLLLGDIMAAFGEGTKDRLATSSLIEYLTAMEERPWSEYRRGKPLTGRSIATLLKGFSIVPRAIRFTHCTAKGYLRSQFKDAWLRYLPGPED